MSFGGKRIIDSQSFIIPAEYSLDQLTISVGQLLKSWKRQGWNDVINICIALSIFLLLTTMLYAVGKSWKETDKVGVILAFSFSVIWSLVIMLVVQWILQNLGFSKGLKEFLSKPKDCKLIEADFAGYGLMHSTGGPHGALIGRKVKWKLDGQNGCTPVVRNEVLAKSYGHKILVASLPGCKRNLVPLGILQKY